MIASESSSSRWSVVGGDVAQHGERQAFVAPRLLVAAELAAPRRSRSWSSDDGSAGTRDARGARQIVEMALDGAELEGERARIAVVEDDEVEHRRGLELAEIARAVGDGAVAQLEREPHRGVPVDRRLG